MLNAAFCRVPKRRCVCLCVLSVCGCLTFSTRADMQCRRAGELCYFHFGAWLAAKEVAKDCCHCETEFSSSLFLAQHLSLNLRAVTLPPSQPIWGCVDVLKTTGILKEFSTHKFHSFSLLSKHKRLKMCVTFTLRSFYCQEKENLSQRTKSNIDDSFSCCWAFLRPLSLCRKGMKSNKKRKNRRKTSCNTITSHSHAQSFAWGLAPAVAAKKKRNERRKTIFH